MTADMLFQFLIGKLKTVINIGVYSVYGGYIQYHSPRINRDVVSIPHR
jgi:hypothetical protein